MQNRRSDKPALIGRDPRNRDHVKWAIDYITSLASGRHITVATAADLRRVNLPVPPNFTVRKTMPRNQPVLAAFFFLEEGLLFPDNVITKCNGCGAALQIRPHAQPAKMCLCCFCTVDRMLAEQAARAKTNRPTARQRERKKVDG